MSDLTPEHAMHDAIAKLYRENLSLESRLSDATEAQQVLGLKLAQAEAERDALKVDAGRYRFLRDAVEPPHGVSKADVIYLQHLHGAELDAAIDAAKEQQ